MKVKSLLTQYFQGEQVYNYGGLVPGILFPNPSPSPTPSNTPTPSITPTTTPTITPTNTTTNTPSPTQTKTPTQTTTPTNTPSTTPVNPIVILNDGGLTTDYSIYSYDGLNYTPSLNSNIFTGDTFSMASNGSRIIAASFSGDIPYTNDGITWNNSNNSKLLFDRVFGVHWTGNRFISQGYLVGTNKTLLAYSNDGATWTGISGASISAFGSTQIQSSFAQRGTRILAFNASSATGDTITFSNDDGATWSGSTNANTIFSGTAACGLGIDSLAMFVAGSMNVGPSPYVLGYSFNGNDWSGGTYPVGVSFINQFATNGTIILAAEEGSLGLLTSTDGINWYDNTNISSCLLVVKSVIWTGSMFIAAGYDVGSTGGFVATSTDGITWSSNTNTDTTSPSALAWVRSMIKR